MIYVYLTSITNVLINSNETILSNRFISHFLLANHKCVNSGLLYTVHRLFKHDISRIVFPFVSLDEMQDLSDKYKLTFDFYSQYTEVEIHTSSQYRDETINPGAPPYTVPALNVIYKTPPAPYVKFYDKNFKSVQHSGFRLELFDIFSCYLSLSLKDSFITGENRPLFPDFLLNYEIVVVPDGHPLELLLGRITWGFPHIRHMFKA